MVHYSNLQQLKIEVSYRRETIESLETTIVNGIRVYNIDTLCAMKVRAYLARDTMRDLYDVLFITNNYFDVLSEKSKKALALAFERKDESQYDYLVKTQEDPLLNTTDMAKHFLEAIERLSSCNK